ncbi:hypothetical protein HaLaN_30605, partial [Haematococcus lacustris]
MGHRLSVQIIKAAARALHDQRDDDAPDDYRGNRRQLANDGNVSWVRVTVQLTGYWSQAAADAGLRALDAATRSGALAFVFFATEPKYDYLQIWDTEGPRALLTGTQLTSLGSPIASPSSGPTPRLPLAGLQLTTDTGVMLLNFRSDASLQQPGFAASYSAQQELAFGIVDTDPFFQLYVQQQGRAQGQALLRHQHLTTAAHQRLQTLQMQQQLRQMNMTLAAQERDQVLQFWASQQGIPRAAVLKRQHQLLRQWHAEQL